MSTAAANEDHAARARRQDIDRKRRARRAGQPHHSVHRSDGTGPTSGAQRAVMDAAVKKAYGGKRKSIDGSARRGEATSS